jgi:hypothetical protein
MRYRVDWKAACRAASNSFHSCPVLSLVLAGSPVTASMGVARVPRFDENSRNRVPHVSSMDKRAKETNLTQERYSRQHGFGAEFNEAPKWRSIVTACIFNGQDERDIHCSAVLRRGMKTSTWILDTIYENRRDIF